MKKEEIKEASGFLLITLIILIITGSFSGHIDLQAVLVKGILVFLIVAAVYMAGEKHKIG